MAFEFLEPFLDMGKVCAGNMKTTHILMSMLYTFRLFRKSFCRICLKSDFFL